MLAACAVALFCPGFAGAVTVVEDKLTGAAGSRASTPAVTRPPAHISEAALMRGAGLTGSAAANSISASGWTGEATDYFEFGFDVAAGFQVALDRIKRP
jgi:hypothetical protein